jgi:hypothetical protein
VARKSDEDAGAKQRLIKNIVGSLGNGVPRRIQKLQVRHFYKADPAYGTGVTKGLGLNIEDVIAEKVAASAGIKSAARVMARERSVNDGKYFGESLSWICHGGWRAVSPAFHRGTIHS